MPAVAIKTFDAMEAPEWKGQRPKPPIEIDPHLLEAPPVPPRFLHHSSPETKRKPAPTLTLSHPTPSPSPLKLLIPAKPARPLDNVQYTTDEEAWFSNDVCFEEKHVVPNTIVQTRKWRHVWLSLMCATILLTGAGSSIAWAIYRNV